MKAMIFAAGLGTRLRPLTDAVPKAMVQVGGKPMLQIALDRCQAAGIQEVVINVHYLPDVIRQFLSTYDSQGMTIHISDESDQILETGGGLLHAQKYLDGDQPFLLANADILTNIDIQHFFETHEKLGGIATLAVRDRPSSRKLLFDNYNRLLGRADSQQTGQEYAFSGYHIVSPRIFFLATRSGKFSITDWYMDICKQEEIYSYLHQDDIWIDVGTLEKLQQAQQVYEHNRSLF